MNGQFERLRNQIRDNQIDQLIRMKPGRTLDMLIVKHVQNHLVEKWSVDGEDDYYFVPTKAVKQLTKENFERVPNYSTSVYAAIELLTQLTNWYIAKTSEEGYQAKVIAQSDVNLRLPHFSEFAEAVAKACLFEVIVSNKIIDELN
jgi:hypothetical protein